jgi:hypothetical protein
MTSNAFRAPLPPFVPGRTRSLPAQPSANVAPTPWEASAAARQAARRNAASMAALERDHGMQGWPVLGDEGTAGPVWGDDAAANVNAGNGGGPAVATAPAQAPAAGDRPASIQAVEEDGGDAEFPLEAFFVPDHCTRMPAGYDPEVHRAISQRVAARLDELAATIRRSGMHTIGATPSADDLSRIVAAVVAGFYARQPD